MAAVGIFCSFCCQGRSEALIKPGAGDAVEAWARTRPHSADASVVRYAESRRRDGHTVNGHRREAAQWDMRGPIAAAQLQALSMGEMFPG